MDNEPFENSVNDNNMDNSYETKIYNLLNKDLMVHDVTIIERGLTNLFDLVFNNNTNNNDNGRNFKLIVELRAIFTVVQLIKKWNDNEQVQVIASVFMVRFFDQIVTNEKCFDTLFNDNYYFDILFTTMENYLTCLSIQENCLRQLTYFATNWKAFHEYLALDDTYRQDVIFNAANQFPDKVIIQSLACKCFYKIKTTKFESLNTEIKLNDLSIIRMIGKSLNQCHDDKQYCDQAYELLGLSIPKYCDRLARETWPP